jgi:hypothetical protein
LIKELRMKLCKDCKWFLPAFARFTAQCTGPHVAMDVVYGKRVMRLPEARYSGGDGLESGAKPCGEQEAFHFERAEVKRRSIFKW